MLLNTFDRLILLNILPKEGDITALRILRTLKEELSFSEDEHKELQFRTGENGLIEWLQSADKPKDVGLGEKARDIVAAELRKLNDQKRLQDMHIPLYERFVEGKE